MALKRTAAPPIVCDMIRGLGQIGDVKNEVSDPSRVGTNIQFCALVLLLP